MNFAVGKRGNAESRFDDNGAGERDPEIIGDSLPRENFPNGNRSRSCGVNGEALRDGDALLAGVNWSCWKKGRSIEFVSKGPNTEKALDILAAIVSTLGGFVFPPFQRLEPAEYGWLLYAILSKIVFNSGGGVAGRMNLVCITYYV